MSDYRGELTRTVDVGSLIAFGTAKPAVFPTCVRSTSDRRWCGRSPLPRLSKNKSGRQAPSWQKRCSRSQCDATAPDLKYLDGMRF